MDASKLSRSEYLAIAGSLLLIIALFLPWYATSAGNEAANIDGETGSLSGWQVHPILRWLLLLLALAPLILAYIVVRAKELSWARGELTAVAAIAGFGFVFYTGIIDRPGEPSSEIALKVGWFLAMLAVILMLVGSILRSSETQRRRRPPGTFG